MEVYPTPSFTSSPLLFIRIYSKVATMSVTQPTHPIRVHKLPLSEADLNSIDRIAEKVFVATRQWIEMYEETSPEECFIEAYVEGGILVDNDGTNKLNVKHRVVIRSIGEIANG